MRIAQVSPLYFTVPPHDHGGTERVVATLTNALCERNHSVRLYAADGSSTRADLSPQGQAVSTVPNAPPSLISAMEIVMLDRVAEAAEAGAYDVIHCHTELAHAAVLRAVRERAVMTIHWRADEADRQAYFTHFRDMKVVAISAHQARTLPERNVVGVVHHGLEKTRYRLGPGGTRAAFIGRMTDQKRPDMAVRIASAAGFGIDLAGTVDVGNPRYFEREVRPLIDGAAVRYLGPVADADKQALLGNAAALLFPIDWPEPFGLVMIEAMACGTPVVAMRKGSVPEVVEDGVTGFVVDTFDDAVAALPAAAALDRARVRERFEARFTAARMAREYEAIYDRIAAGTL